jgi:maltose alpha-D-glucosyltransferase/alpha-amylase
MSVDAWLEHELPRVLPTFLPRQRWFAGKAREIQEVDVEDAVWLTASPRDVAFVVIAVGYADGPMERYGMLLGFADRRTELPMVAPAEQLGAALCAVEAARDANAVRALLSGFLTQRTISMRHGGRLLYGDTNTRADAIIGRVVERGGVEPIGAEQSNTSVHLDRTLVFKLFRKLETGENPELEVGRFLTNHTTFRATPILRGSLTYVSTRGEPSTVGLLQDWIESFSDGWTHVAALLRQPRSGSSAETLARDLYRIGATTADLHAALCAGAAESAFAPEPVTTADVRAWNASLLDRVARTFRLLEQHINGLNPEAHQLATMLLDRRAKIGVAAGVPTPAGRGGFMKIRIHGDYHLGQVLKTHDGFVIIDFEGEPARPLAERRLKASALKDVAGMIRSFDYAIGVADADERRAPDETFARRLRESFLDGYLASARARAASFVPRDREAVDAWIGFFELEKAMYEVDYELNNRPDWAHIPLQGILRILRREA